MKVLIIGAAGRTGEEVGVQAVRAGHNVTAFIHEPRDFQCDYVYVMGGDARDKALLLKAMRGQDAVLDTLGGHLPFLPTSLETDCARNVIETMQEAEVHRLVILSALGEGESKANVQPYYRHLMMPTMLHGVMRDKADMEEIVEKSSLDWVIVRPATLTDGEPRGVHVLDSETAEKAHSVTRADVAHFMLQQLTSDAYLHRAVGISSKPAASHLHNF